MTLIQLILIIFGAFGCGTVVARFRRGGLSRAQLAFWLLLWLAVIAVVALPQTASFLAMGLGVGRGADVMIYLAIATLFYLQFRLLARLEDQERQITQLTRALALKDLDSSHER